MAPQDQEHIQCNIKPSQCGHLPCITSTTAITTVITTVISMCACLFWTFSSRNTDPVRTSGPYGEQSSALMRLNLISEVKINVRCELSLKVKV